MIRIKMDFSGLDKEVAKAKEKLHHEIVTEMQRIGESYINEGRRATDYSGLKRYENHTNNLRNAHSFRIYRDGQKVTDHMGEINGMANPTDAMFEEKVKGDGYELIVGDGMDYASHVEGKGYNVSTSGFMLVERKVEEFNNKKSK